MRKPDVNKLTCFIDLHLHFDGAITLENCKALMAINHLDLKLSDKEICQLIQIDDSCHDLNEYLSKFDFVLTLLQSKEAIETCVFNICEELKHNHTIYAELKFAPALLTKKGLSQEETVLAALNGLKKSGFNGQLILCGMRFDNFEKENRETADLVKKYLGKGVCAYDLAGAEALYKTSDFKDLFDYVKSLDIPYVIHAGEADGPSSVYSAIEFGAQRIGHGIRCVEDEKCLQLIVDKKIPLELCITSNVDTCIFDRIEDFPIRKLMDVGAICTINTDDPGISNTNIINEWQLLVDNFNFDYNDIRQLLINSANSAFISNDDKQILINIINKNIDELIKENE